MKSFDEFYEMRDDDNPKYIFQTLSLPLLMGIANGTINARELANKELDNRGLDHSTGRWIGFKK